MPLGIPRAGGSGLVPLCGLSIVHHGSQGRDSRENKLLGQERRAGKVSTGAGFKERGARVPLGCSGGPPGPSCPLGLALTRIAGTRVMVTGLVRREGRRVSLGLRSPAGGLYRQALPRTPRPFPRNAPWTSVGRRVSTGHKCPQGRFCGRIPSCALDEGTLLGQENV